MYDRVLDETVTIPIEEILKIIEDSKRSSILSSVIEQIKHLTRSVRSTNSNMMKIVRQYGSDEVNKQMLMESDRMLNIIDKNLVSLK